MEENKYYTPSIKELHQGFELEINQKHLSTDNTFVDIWNKMTYNLSSPISWSEEIRVKYLDKEDIESLGWNHVGSLWFNKDRWKLRKWKDDQLDIWYDHLTMNRMGEEELELRFRGIIKNKSELQKLMKQLGIDG